MRAHRPPSPVASATWAIALAGLIALASGPPSLADDDPATADGYRLHRTAVAVYDSSGGFDVYVRLDRALPREQDDSGHPVNGGGIRLEGINGFTGARRAGVRGRHCYTTAVDIDDPDLDPPEVLRRPREGAKARVIVRVRGVRRSLRGRAELVPVAKATRHPEKRLGC